ncbi:MAG: carboxypeptidase regulatory-like domain-containing protein, partial [Acidobacteria bacterium]|nr:carboxypeptidase regulatory-like domain-containing protein [Acidobacteriota bacterium]
MRSLVSSLALAVVVTAVAGAIGVQPDQSRLTGRVTDGSGAALPGATVTIAGPGSRPIVVVTDEVGQYQTPPLQPGSYSVTFEMSGFETRTNPTIVLGPGEVFVLDRQLGLAALTETVTVTGEAPKPPPPPAAPLPPLRTRPQAVPVPKTMLASVCGPDKPVEVSYTVGHIAAHRDDPRRELYGPGDVLLVDVGADMGMKAGQNFVVRRRFRYGDKSAPAKHATFGEHTAGLVQVV